MSTHLHTRFIPIWKQAPFIRLLLPLMSGIVIQWYLPFTVFKLSAISIIAVLLLVVLLFTKFKSSFRFGIITSFTMLLAGGWLVQVNQPDKYITRMKQQLYKNKTIIATLDEPPVIKTKSYKANATMRFVDSSGKIVYCKGGIILYFLKEKAAPSLKYGDEIAFKKPLTTLSNSLNPGAFDFSRYSAFHGIYFQVFLAPGDYKILRSTNANPFYNTLYNAREFVINAFKKYLPGKIESGLAEALLVGYKDDLDKDLIEQYANTGVVHIIAISGMHLGLIYGLFFTFFKPLRKRKAGNIISGILIILILWFFSFLTGAAPSITRSALMFTAIIIGSSFNKKMIIYNSLAVSAFILLLFNPFNLWDVGFQLSYAALISISILSKPITNLLTFPNKILQVIWQLTAVTVSAQVFTLPFVIYHFHQFPLSFILSNLVAVPLSSLILYCLIAVLVLSPFTLPAKLAGWCSYYLIKLMNWYIALIARLPFSRIDNIYINIVQAAILTLMLSAICWWILRRSSKGLVAASISSFVLFVMYDVQWLQTKKQQKLVVYNVPGKLAIDILHGHTYTFIGDSSLQQKSFLQNFHLLPARIQNRVALQQNIAVPATGFYQVNYKQTRLLIIDTNPSMVKPFHINTGLLVVGGGCKINPARLLQNISCTTIVLNATVPPWRVSKWKIAADSLHLRLHSVQQQGAFEATL